MKKIRNHLIPLSLGLLTLPTQAAVLLYEPFDYTATETIAGKGGSESGFDGSSSWAENALGTTEITAGSSSFGTLATTGNKFHYNNSFGSVNYDKLAYASRAMNVSASSGELYITFLMQGPSGFRLNGGVYINGSIKEFGATRTEYFNADRGASPDRPHLYYADQLATAVDNPVTATTYMYVQKYTGLGTGSGGTAQLWLIDSGDYDTIAADGNVTTAELDANSLTSTSVLTLAGAAPTLDGSEELRILLHDFGGGHTDYTLDEIRVATTLNEAMDIVPEPSSSALLGLAGLALILRRRK
ncbi:MAG: PEP-CTERM sorting domain-containing protein [Akkermansiaceae bacterium]|nr:PEP-CTERM sorting domain-containing protein [Akkermansiaceae bacterium]